MHTKSSEPEPRPKPMEQECRQPKPLQQQVAQVKELVQVEDIAQPEFAQIDLVQLEVL